MKQLTEAQAWREIARRIEKGTWTKNPNGWENGGLCDVVWTLSDEGRVGSDTCRSMLRRVDEHRDDLSGFGYYWPFLEETPRIIAATLLAEEAKAEGALR